MHDHGRLSGARSARPPLGPAIHKLAGRLRHARRKPGSQQLQLLCYSSLVQKLLNSIHAVYVLPRMVYCGAVCGAAAARASRAPEREALQPPRMLGVGEARTDAGLSTRGCTGCVPSLPTQHCVLPPFITPGHLETIILLGIPIKSQSVSGMIYTTRSNEGCCAS